MEETIFRSGSTTYYWSSKFFPRAVRHDVFDLYSFVRVVDDYVDRVPANPDAFYSIRKHWAEAYTQQLDTAKKVNDKVEERIVKNMLRLVNTYEFDPAWVESFLDAMESDLRTTRYQTIEDSLRYVYGSAEVVGLMMARILGLPKQSHEAAAMQGRAMQWINFIRDIAEDNEMGRRYFSQEDLDRFKLPDLTHETAQQHPDAFHDFIHYQLERYTAWQTEANEGYHFIPKRLRIPLQTATDMYNWTAQVIARDPMVVFQRQVKPSKAHVLLHALRNTI